MPGLPDGDSQSWTRVAATRRLICAWVAKFSGGEARSLARSLGRRWWNGARRGGGSGGGVARGGGRTPAGTALASGRRSSARWRMGQGGSSSCGLQHATVCTMCGLVGWRLRGGYRDGRGCRFGAAAAAVGDAGVAASNGPQSASRECGRRARGRGRGRGRDGAIYERSRPGRLCRSRTNSRGRARSGDPTLNSRPLHGHADRTACSDGWCVLSAAAHKGGGDVLAGGAQARRHMACRRFGRLWQRCMQPTTRPPAAALQALLRRVALRRRPPPPTASIRPLPIAAACWRPAPPLAAHFWRRAAPRGQRPNRAASHTAGEQAPFRPPCAPNAARSSQIGRDKSLPGASDKSGS